MILMTDATTSGTSKDVAIGIGRNSSSAFAGTKGSVGFGSASSANSRMSPSSKYTLTPTIGIDTFTACESGNATASFTSTFGGTQTNMTLSARWRA